MKKIMNAHTTLLALGVLQPASAREVRGFLDTVYGEGGATPTTDEVEAFLVEQLKLKRVVRLNEAGQPFYSLTLSGTYYLPADLRKTRDKFRAYLLRDAHRARYIESRGIIDEDLAGASPAGDISSGVKGRAANKLGRTAFGRRSAYGRPYWPRISRQFTKRTGPTRYPRDTFPSLLSFESVEQLQLASGRDQRWDYLSLGLSLGISPQLVWNIAHQQARHYRSFEIAKRGGGTRLIETPRVFLKVIQWFLSDFVLDNLHCHDNVHSFAFKRSIFTNAEKHVGQQYVGNVDIADFFGTITRQHIVQVLLDNNFHENEAAVIANLCTKDGRLPQGAPTSPILSNAALNGFDELAKVFCDENDLKYSRYADDITISGADRNLVADAIARSSEWLGQFGFSLNHQKTRIASQFGQQKVTGVVVNEAAAPPRDYRRKVRSMFHKAKLYPAEYVQKIPQLGGALGFLKMFPKLESSDEIRSYEETLKYLRDMQRAL